jgi:hypothetical protein
MNANWVLSGGGTITWNGSVVSGTNRVLAIPLNNAFASDGYVQVLEGSWSLNLGPWDAAYWVPNSLPSPPNAGYGAINIVNYTIVANQIGSNWIFICATNFDDYALKWGPGFITIPSGGMYSAYSGVGGGASWNLMGITSKIALGYSAGLNNQGAQSIAIGENGGYNNQKARCVAVGYHAGYNNQSGDSIAVGVYAGYSNQGPNAVSIGNLAGQYDHGSNCVAIGCNAGLYAPNANCVAIGTNAGANSGYSNTIAIGQNAGYLSARQNTIAIGTNAGQSNQLERAIAIGVNAGSNAQGGDSIAIGNGAGQTNQYYNSVAIGIYAGNISQGITSVAVGIAAGSNNQGEYAVAIGNSAGNLKQGSTAVAIGVEAGRDNQGLYGTAIGYQAGFSGQLTNGIAIGVYAGYSNQGSNSIAIGYQAGHTNQNVNSIVLNATGSTLNASVPGFVVAPVRQQTGTYLMAYDTTTNEISYTATSSSDERLKKDISDTQLGLSFINQLRPIQFRWVDRNTLGLDASGHCLPSTSPGVRVHQGLIAQEVKKVLDDMGVDSAIHVSISSKPVTKSKITTDASGKQTISNFIEINPLDGVQGVRYEQLISPIIQSVKDVYALVQTQAIQIQTLQQTVSNLMSSK